MNATAAVAAGFKELAVAVVVAVEFVLEFVLEVPALLLLIWFGTLLPPGMSGMWWCDAAPNGDANDEDDDDDDAANETGVLPFE